MSAWGDEKAATALRLISKRGTAATLTRRVRAAMTASGDRADTPLPSDTVGVLLPGEGTVLVEGAERRAGRVLLAAVLPEPSPGDVLTIQGSQVVITEAKNMRPDGTLIYSDLEVAL